MSRIREELAALERAIADEEAAQQTRIAAVLPRHRASAENLAHYLRLRREDIHRLQLDLGAVGLSSLGRCEGHVRDSLRRVTAWLAGNRGDTSLDASASLDLENASQVLHANTRALFGPRPANRHVYIMVTAPDAAEASAKWVDEVLDAGADLLRINGAYGSPAEWTTITSMFKAGAAARGKAGPVVVDLPGPKLRSEVRELERPVVHLPRHKDRFGRTVAPTRVVLVAERKGGAEIPVVPAWLEGMRRGDVVELKDAGERSRRLVVGERTAAGVEATCSRSLYVTTRLPLVWRRGKEVLGRGHVGPMPPEPKVVELHVGSAFWLRGDGKGRGTGIPELYFSEPELLRGVRPRERVVLDDGNVAAVVREVRDGDLLCEVRHTRQSPVRIRSGKGVAFPDGDVGLGALGDNDELALEFAVEHADAVGVSFVNSAADVSRVGERLRRANRPRVGMILKLETRSAMQNLPLILFEALKYHPVGLMIARGDLAVELSFERLAEMQEELLWFGEACHLPVVWATQVLDTVAHSSVPTRAEVTDAAMSMRAECVMLNKGPHIAEATRMLSDIICRMETHQYKKRSLYRRLSLAGAPGEERAVEPEKAPSRYEASRSATGGSPAT